MHSRGEFEAMHTQPEVPDMLKRGFAGFRTAIEKAKSAGVADAAIVLDVGIGFGKTQAAEFRIDRQT